MSENNILNFERKTQDQNPVDEYINLLKDSNAPENTETYHMVQVLHTPQELDTVPNIETGGTPRNKRWGAVCNIAVIPGLDRVPTGNLTIPSSPCVLVYADSVEDLRDRINYEVSKSIRMAEIVSENENISQEISARLAQEGVNV